MNFRLISILALLTSLAPARDMEKLPADPFYAKYEPYKAPSPAGLLLKKGDRLAICGDSITEQKMYSLLMEAYLTASLPELEITARQYGWSGEQAGGFLRRMKNDVLRFKPTIATTCYGMNDHGYVPYKEEIAAQYRQNQTDVVKAFKEAGTRVVLGSPGTISTLPGWVKNAAGTWEDLNASLCKFRNIDIEIAEKEGVAFADVWLPMLHATLASEKAYGQEFDVAGDDGVHPGWAGQVMMATAFLHALGVDGNIGIFTVDMAGKAEAGDGHAVKSWADGKLTVSSTRWPFCTGPGPLDKDNSLRAGMALSKFDERFNRLLLKVSGLKTAKATVTWGQETKTFTKEQLAAGVNLAAEFQTNPFSAPYAQLWKAVADKQAYETKQIKQIFHGAEGKKDMEAAVTATEKERTPLAEAIKAAHIPVEHTVTVKPVE
jgi:lysophospholipase L1-like esterase